MERELSPKGRILVRLWMYGPIFVALITLILFCVAIIEPRSLAVLWVTFLLAIMTIFGTFAFKESGYRYYLPTRSSFIDLIVAYAVFVAVCYGIDYLSQTSHEIDLNGVLILSSVCMFFFAPHILFRAFRRRKDQVYKS